MSTSLTIIPVFLDTVDTEVVNAAIWLPALIQDYFMINAKQGHTRQYEVLEHRFGLNSKSRLTLEEIGILFDVTRERIRQIEARALSSLRQFLNSGIDAQREKAINEEIRAELYNYRESLKKLGPVCAEETILGHTKTFFNAPEIDIATMRLFLTVFGYESVGFESHQSLGERFAWVLSENVDTQRLEAAMVACFRYLREVAIAKPYSEIKLAINSKIKVQNRFSDFELQQALGLLTDVIEQLEDQTHRIKFENLKSIPDKIYRLLHISGEPLHAREIARVLNKEAFRTGERSRITPHHVGSRLSGDNRFTSVGRSGEWALAEWNMVATDTILTLMQDALHEAGEPLSSQAIYEYVSARRTVKRNATQAYLSYDPHFVRVGKDLFALADWGMLSVSYSVKPRRRIFSKAKLAEYIERAFTESNLKEMFVSDLAKQISSMEEGVSPQSVYNVIISSPAINITDKIIGKQIRKVAIFNPGYRNKLTKSELVTKDIPMGQLIQNTIRDLLRKQPQLALPLSSIRDTVSVQVHCPPASVYGALSQMQDIEKYKHDDGFTYCRLVTTSENYNEYVGKLPDGKVKEEIKRALGLLHIDTIDLALFQLGKLFEYTLQNYMLKVQAKGLIPVSADDLSKLFKMVQWAGRTGIISDETALQYLRIERNDRGHGIPPGLDEREALLKNAPVLVKFYLAYIVLIEERASKII
jgi:hypothetical protein